MRSPRLIHGVAFEDADEECGAVVGDYEEAGEGVDDAGGADEQGFGAMEEVVVDEAEGEFDGEGGEFEEDLVEPVELAVGAWEGLDWVVVRGWGDGALLLGGRGSVRCGGEGRRRAGRSPIR